MGGLCVRWAARVAGVIVVALLAGTARGDVSGSEGTLRASIGFDPQLDPQLAFLFDPIQDATCAKLLNYRSRRTLRSATLYPEVARAFPTVSRDGRTYRFALRSGFRFSDGTRIDAANYAAAIRRLLNPALRADGAGFASDVAGLQATGLRLTVTLKQPSGDFLARIATLPFFCPIPAGLPVDPAGVELLVRSGPYFIARHSANQEIVLARNRFYLGARRPRLDKITFKIDARPTGDRIPLVESGEVDYIVSRGMAPDVAVQLARRYGVGRERFFAVPTLQTMFLVVNNTRALFRDNAPLRRALNVAVDRPEILRRSLPTPLNAKRTDQILPPGIAGFREAKLYPLGGADVSTAARLARGHLRGSKAVLYSSRDRLPAAAVIAFNLGKIGLDVQIQAFPGTIFLERIATPGEPFDLALLGWVADYPDPASFLIDFPRLYPGLLGPELARKAARANTLRGRTRTSAFGDLDVAAMRTEAPIVPLFNASALAFVSKRVGCVTFAPATAGIIDLTAVCLK